MALPTPVNQENIKVRISDGTFRNICPFPVGYIYQSYKSTSPGNIFGGTWTPITGRFLYCNNGTSTGGTNNMRLEEQHLPWHTHYPSNRTVVYSPNLKGNIGFATGKNAASFGWMYQNAPNEVDRVDANTELFTPTAFSIMPAYQTCYAWRRTA